MKQTSRIQNLLLAAIALFLGMIAIRPYISPELIAHADGARFEHVTIVSPMFLYKGNQGVLLADKRNGNIWFVGKRQEVEMSFLDPVFVSRLPLDKLEQGPQ